MITTALYKEGTQGSAPAYDHSQGRGRSKASVLPHRPPHPRASHPPTSTQANACVETGLPQVFLLTKIVSLTLRESTSILCGSISQICAAT